MSANGRFDVGGVWLDRPFRIRRLGHFGLYTDDPAAARRFYVDLLGFQISDEVDYTDRLAGHAQVAELRQHKGYFTRYGTDHHAFVLFPRRVFAALGRAVPPEIAINQLTWQLGSLKEVVEANQWLMRNQVRIDRSGRDMPGSNWHTYMFDPDGERNELYYGIEQIGWNGRSKPRAMYDGRFDKVAELPQGPEVREVDKAAEASIDLSAGHRHREAMPFDYEVGGIMMARPFRITGIGPVRLLVRDMEAAVEFYRDRLGFEISEEVMWHGQRCVFLRVNTEHHSVALYPASLAAALDLPHRTLCLSFGVRVNDYRQLRDAIAFLKRQGVRILHLPQELLPGMDYNAFAVDPDGHLIQLYFAMEQIGWDGRPRPAAERRRIDNQAWPDTVEAQSDTFRGEPFLGPWA
ncbi:MAG TPA: VOC family protein [Stellaceae bacterium]|nr:VOC family protein [Stellaceae bacterium]